MYNLYNVLFVHLLPHVGLDSQLKLLRLFFHLTTMAVHTQRAHFPCETVDKIIPYCSNGDISLDVLYSAAWCYTKSIYSAASDVTTSLVRRCSRADVFQVSPVSATFAKHMTIKQACHSIQIGEADSMDSQGLFKQPDNGAIFQKLEGSTIIAVEDTEALQFADSRVQDGKPSHLCVIINGAHINLRYTPNAVPTCSSELLLDTFVKVLSEFVGRPHDTYLLDLDIIGPRNRAILDSWISQKLARVDRCIHDFVDEHARSKPEKEAVVSTHGPNFNYAQLSALSDKLAVHLISMGVKKGNIVPILFDRSSIAVLAVVSVMKAGGAYVGFAVESPINFLTECAEIAEASIIITSRQHENLVREMARCPLVLDSELLASLENGTSLNGFQSPAQASDLVYLVFTSGSTGVPKVCAHF